MALLARNGVESEVVYPACCGMPQLEQGDLATVDGKAAKVAAAKPAGICLARGGPTSHVAILCAGMGLPALVAMGEDAALIDLSGETPDALHDLGGVSRLVDRIGVASPTADAR